MVRGKCNPVREFSNRGSGGVEPWFGAPCFPDNFPLSLGYLATIPAQKRTFRPRLPLALSRDWHPCLSAGSVLHKFRNPGGRGSFERLPPNPPADKNCHIADGWRAIAVVSPAPDVSPPGVRVRHPLGVGRPSRLGRPPSLSPTRLSLAATANIKPLRHREGL